MPGIFGAYKKEQGENINILMGSMILSMNHGGRLRIDKFIDEDRGLCMKRGLLLTLAQVPISAQGYFG